MQSFSNLLMSDNLKRLDISKNEKFGQEEDALPQFERLARLYKKPHENISPGDQIRRKIDRKIG
ncbi:hypothetical protein CCS41_08230 [Candidatus Fukatsuia symbiotica]|uniref:Uncharacterized protein n=1 Tax=Candidatus Fukatsuia symbiotica TaxID=1878942 RepID=A0A2U8I8S7_9GAMM|nr:hypothetical protein CCS41_08230 [Candidatus Fukatsuia symbiotica]